MKRFDRWKVLLAGLMFASLGILFMPIMKWDNVTMSPFEIIYVPSEILKLLNRFGSVATLISEELKPYVFLVFLLAGIAVAAAILVLFLKDKMAYISSAIGSVVNIAIALFGVWELKLALATVNDTITFFKFDIDIKLIMTTIVSWCVLYLLVLAGSIFGLLRENRSFVNKRLKRQLRKKPEENRFYGGVIGEAGIYRDKVRSLDRGEALTFGTDREKCGVLLELPGERCVYCFLRYDEKRGEYQLEPCYKRSVFLESGQPLGAGRTYCLPRGMKVMIGNEKNRFTLA